jgi:hypothetical protein
MKVTTKTAKQYAAEAAKAYANLNTWGTVVALLESGALNGGQTHAAQQRVIKIAQVEMQKHLVQYDRAVASVVAMTT